MGNYRNWGGAREAGGGDRGKNDLDNVPVGWDPLVAMDQAQRDTGHAQCLDTTRLNRGEASQRRKWVSRVFKDSLESAGRRFPCSRTECWSKGIKGNPCEWGTIMKGGQDALK